MSVWPQSPAQASACLAFLRAAFGLASACASEPYPYKICKGRFQRLCLWQARLRAGPTGPPPRSMPEGHLRERNQFDILKRNFCFLRAWRRPTLPCLKTKYHRRWEFSRPSSEWDRVQASRHSHQAGKKQKRLLFCLASGAGGNIRSLRLRACARRAVALASASLRNRTLAHSAKERRFQQTTYEYILWCVLSVTLSLPSFPTAMLLARPTGRRPNGRKPSRRMPAPGV